MPPAAIIAGCFVDPCATLPERELLVPQLGSDDLPEDRSHEQYFFDPPTTETLADLAGCFALPCCLCAPTVGRALVRRGVAARLLDRDERFADVPGFRAFDLARPSWTGERYGLILCDPPFFNIPLRALYRAIHLLAQHDPSQPLAISYLARREAALLRRFGPFGLQPTGYQPGYRSVSEVEKNRICFYANFPWGI